MSRFTINKEDGTEIAYGFDHICGYFVQQFDPTEDGSEKVSVDLDNLTTSRIDIFEKMIELGVPEEHYKYVALDLPF